VHRCESCGYLAEIPHDVTCAQCGVVGAWEGHLPCVQPVVSRETAPSRLLDVQELTGERWSTGDNSIDALLGGGWWPGESVLVHGPRGSGKSRLCLRWAGACSPALVVQTEMSPELCREVAIGSGASLAEVYIRDSFEHWQSAASNVDARLVVFDSVSRAPRPVPFVRDAISWAAAERRVVLLISHTNSRGAASGPTSLEHDPDSVLKINQAGRGRCRLMVVKRRLTLQNSILVGLGNPVQAHLAGRSRGRRTDGT
jgi:DNA repair protein RadA/Sms